MSSSIPKPRFSAFGQIFPILWAVALLLAPGWVQAEPGSGDFQAITNAPPVVNAQSQTTEVYPVDPTRIGVLLPLSGKFAPPGKEVKRGLELAIDQALPASTGPFRLVYRDTQDDPELTARAVRDLVEFDHVVGIIGPLVSATVDAAAIEAARLEVPLIILSQKSEVPYLGSYVFRLFMTPEAQIRRLVDYAMGKLELKNFAVIYPKQRYGMELTSLFWDEVTSRGGEIVGAEDFDRGTKDFVNLARRVGGQFYQKPRAEELREGKKAYKEALEEAGKDPKKAPPYELPPVVDFDAIFMPAPYRTASLVAATLAFQEIPVGRFTVTKEQKPVRLLGSSAWNNPEIIRQGGEYVDGAIFVDHFFASSESPEVRSFVKDFMAVHQRPPSVFAAIGFDAVGIMTKLLRAQPTHRVGLRDRLSAMEGYAGVTGKTSFDANGELTKDLFVITVKRKDLRQLEPEIPKPEKKK